VVIVVVVVVVELQLGLGNDKALRFGNGREGDGASIGLEEVEDIRRGMVGRGDPAVFALREMRWSWVWAIL